MKRGLLLHSVALSAVVLSTPSVVSAFVAPKTTTSTSISQQQQKQYTTTFNNARSSLDNNNNVNSLLHNQRITPSSTTSLSALPISVASIGKFYKGFPLLAGFLTASTKACFADSLAQYRDVCTTKFNYKRNIAMISYSGLTLGLLCEIMYNRIFPLIFGPPIAASAPGGLVRAMKMTLFDAFINAPLIWLPPAYIAQAVVYRYPKREAIQKYIVDVKENGLLKKYWSLWLPMSMINFAFIPAHFRIAFVAAVSFFWMIILSIVSNNDQDPESCPLEPEPGLVDPRALE